LQTHKLSKGWLVFAIIERNWDAIYMEDSGTYAIYSTDKLKNIKKLNLD